MWASCSIRPRSTYGSPVPSRDISSSCHFRFISPTTLYLVRSGPPSSPRVLPALSPTLASDLHQNFQWLWGTLFSQAPSLSCPVTSHFHSASWVTVAKTILAFMSASYHLSPAKFTPQRGRCRGRGTTRARRCRAAPRLRPSSRLPCRPGE